MSKYTPDRWVMVKTNFNGAQYYKILASWYGGYMGSDSWKLSSGTLCTQFDKKTNQYHFPQVSKSEYVCYKNTYGTSGYTQGVFLNWVKCLEERGSSGCLIILPEDTDFLTLDYING
jgi:hypothetical protein